jgi:hypothetical protein
MPSLPCATLIQSNPSSTSQIAISIVRSTMERNIQFTRSLLQLRKAFVRFRSKIVTHRHNSAVV